MKRHSVIVTDSDMERLTHLSQALKQPLFRDQAQLESLDQALDSAEEMPTDRVPATVIRMNSHVHVLDLDTQRKDVYMLVFPENANISRGRISVLAPLGIALLGRTQGDVIKAKVPWGTRT